MSAQKSQMFYSITGIQLSEGSPTLIDLYIVTRELSEDEQAELEAGNTCCWDTIYEKYTIPDKFIAYRYVLYSTAGVQIVMDVVTSEVTDRVDSDGNSDYTNYDIFERIISPSTHRWKYTETHTARD